MDEHSQRQLESYFSAITKWSSAYASIRLHVVGVRTGEALEAVAMRLYLDVGADRECKESFRSGRIEAHEISLSTAGCDAQEVARSLASAAGFNAPGCGCIRLPSTEQVGVFIAPPSLLHPEGLNSGSRLAVLSVGGGHYANLLPQPDSDWLLRAADVPYDSVQELATDYGVGALHGDRALFEVVARSVIEVLAESAVVGTRASLGICMAASLDRVRAKIGFRVVHQGNVVKRGAIGGSSLTWSDRGRVIVGIGEIEVPAGAVVQCVASFDDEAHHVQWRADPATFFNPRAAIFALIDPSGALVKSYIRPESPPKGKAADDFEAAISWLLWTLGFSVASFGTHPKTRDTFDVVATTPRGDFLVVECTLGLLRTEGKLSKLAARAVHVREVLAASNMKHLRVLPVIVTAMTSEQVDADTGPALDLGVLVIAREDLEEVQRELVRSPDADALFERGLRAVRDRQSARRAEQDFTA